MGKERARAVAALGHRVAAVYDSEPGRAEMLARGHSGAEILGTASEVSSRGLDAIFLCTPPSSRREYEMEAIEAKLPFFIEKPIAVHASDCEAVLASLRHTQLVNAVGYMNRCRHSVRLARELLADANVLGACCHWIGKKYQVDWWLRAEHSGGPLNEQATHIFDLFRFLVGEISAVAATAPVRSVGEPPLSMACALQFATGQPGTILYSCESAEKHIDLRIVTEQGVLELAGWDLQLVTNTIDGSIPAACEEDIFVAETGKFLAAVERKDPGSVSCDLFEAYRTQLTVDAARASLESGKLFTLPDQYNLVTAV
jgi:myo-inositol 2-dehydrogenase / D-chiro-inositol 1-dehydrogenase